MTGNDADGGSSDSDSTNATLTEDELFEMLSNRRRRYVLHQLMQEDERIDVGTLSEEIAASEDGIDLQAVSSTDRKRVYTALHQSHLPKMDEAGVLEFNKDRGFVEPTPALEDVEIYMDVVHGREIPWSDYYIGLTALSGVLLALTASGIGPFGAVSSYAWGTFVVVALAVSSIAHRYYARRNRLGITEDPPGVELEYSSNTDG
ncbi:hypothetical protein CYV19_03095 [Natronobacterium gregoryi SP2]|uniref:DUF7344 domain-containing protein n=1 Tax=Natronobacterium gregoryi (strain ATCC 43098 / DSM 3393 / CCM 3738 / CIP 104747 / IAM 13177 / JCM 8860 / NBRC 102187 / NCIMB 2189 / SP2) TaxID=797304 RepID=L9Y9L2_NATGS|nr:hypothetical protein C490_05667 [Natronobacterium gregoryi SP2]PLK21561.1 hypothetical protein CYV19_03095 [Natronobacterium gregoryi SP2]